MGQILKLDEQAAERYTPDHLVARDFGVLTDACLLYTSDAADE